VKIIETLGGADTDRYEYKITQDNRDTDIEEKYFYHHSFVFTTDETFIQSSDTFTIDFIVNTYSFISISNLIIREILDINANVENRELLNHPGNPGHSRYWNNIIPENYRLNVDYIEGISVSGDDIITTDSEGNSLSQNWVNGYYYPVIPKINSNGQFTQNIQEKIPFGTKGRSWDSNDSKSSITNKNIKKETLIHLDLGESVTGDSVPDSSGNENVGIFISDYKIDFEDGSRKPEKAKVRNKLKKSSNDKAF